MKRIQRSRHPGHPQTPTTPTANHTAEHIQQHLARSSSATSSRLDEQYHVTVVVITRPLPHGQGQDIVVEAIHDALAPPQRCWTIAAFDELRDLHTGPLSGSDITELINELRWTDPDPKHDSAEDEIADADRHLAVPETETAD